MKVCSYPHTSFIADSIAVIPAAVIAKGLLKLSCTLAGLTKNVSVRLLRLDSGSFANVMDIDAIEEPLDLDTLPGT